MESTEVAPGRRVLIVEDDCDVSEFYAFLLQRAGYVIATAPDGRIGLQRLVEFRPDVVVCDVMMPEMDGLEFLRRLPSTVSPPPPVVSNSGFDSCEKHAMAQGAFMFLQKPVDANDLGRRRRHCHPSRADGQEHGRAAAGARSRSARARGERRCRLHGAHRRRPLVDPAQPRRARGLGPLVLRLRDRVRQPLRRRNGARAGRLRRSDVRARHVDRARPHLLRRGRQLRLVAVAQRRAAEPVILQPSGGARRLPLLRRHPADHARRRRRREPLSHGPRDARVRRREHADPGAHRARAVAAAGPALRPPGERRAPLLGARAVRTRDPARDHRRRAAARQSQRRRRRAGDRGARQDGCGCRRRLDRRPVRADSRAALRHRPIRANVAGAVRPLDPSARRRRNGGARAARRPRLRACRRGRDRVAPGRAGRVDAVGERARAAGRRGARAGPHARRRRRRARRATRRRRAERSAFGA